MKKIKIKKNYNFNNRNYETFKSIRLDLLVSRYIINGMQSINSIRVTLNYENISFINFYLNCCYLHSLIDHKIQIPRKGIKKYFKYKDLLKK